MQVLYLWATREALSVNIGLSLVAQRLKHLPGMQESWVRSLGWADPLEKEMATHSSTLTWRIPWKEEPGRLQSMGSQRVGHDWATSHTHTQPQPNHNPFFFLISPFEHVHAFDAVCWSLFGFNFAKPLSVYWVLPVPFLWNHFIFQIWIKLLPIYSLNIYLTHIFNLYYT